jgi:hypothetical protein
MKWISSVILSCRGKEYDYNVSFTMSGTANN